MINDKRMHEQPQRMDDRRIQEQPQRMNDKRIHNSRIQEQPQRMNDKKIHEQPQKMDDRRVIQEQLQRMNEIRLQEQPQRMNDIRLHEQQQQKMNDKKSLIAYNERNVDEKTRLRDFLLTNDINFFQNELGMYDAVIRMIPSSVENELLQVQLSKNEERNKNIVQVEDNSLKNSIRSNLHEMNRQSSFKDISKANDQQTTQKMNKGKFPSSTSLHSQNENIPIIIEKQLNNNVPPKKVSNRIDQRIIPKPQQALKRRNDYLTQQQTATRRGDYSAPQKAVETSHCEFPTIEQQDNSRGIVIKKNQATGQDNSVDLNLKNNATEESRPLSMRTAHFSEEKKSSVRRNDSELFRTPSTKKLKTNQIIDDKYPSSQEILKLIHIKKSNINSENVPKELTRVTNKENGMIPNIAKDYSSPGRENQKTNQSRQVSRKNSNASRSNHNNLKQDIQPKPSHSTPKKFTPDKRDQFKTSDFSDHKKYIMTTSDVSLNDRQSRLINKGDQKGHIHPYTPTSPEINASFNDRGSPISNQQQIHKNRSISPYNKQDRAESEQDENYFSFNGSGQKEQIQLIEKDSRIPSPINNQTYMATNKSKQNIPNNLDSKRNQIKYKQQMEEEEDQVNLKKLCSNDLIHYYRFIAGKAKVGSFQKNKPSYQNVKIK